MSLKVPFNLRYWWNLGRLLGVLVTLQILRGIILTFYYDSSPNSFYTVWNIHLNVSNGYLLHIVHLNCSSFIFIFIYLHILKGILFSAFLHQSLIWLRGCLVMTLIIAVSFLGYVLPWGQISLWGATVITNLLTTIPLYGESLVQWIWGGFFVSNYTLKLFFSLHFITPIFLRLLIVIHLILLHYNGSSNPLGGQISIKTEFLPFYAVKDLVNITLIVGMFFSILTAPYILGDCENFIHSNPITSPLHIQPEWYFLNYYCILRAIPNKIGGVIFFIFSISLIFLICLKQNFRSLQNFKIWWVSVSLFVCVNIMLIWLGSCPVEPPFILISQIYSFFYFVWFIGVLRI